MRVATRPAAGSLRLSCSLPQRIRAGCDDRPWTHRGLMTLCHSAFVRVATRRATPLHTKSPFATAHSCGLRLHGLCCLLADGVLCHSAFVRVATFADLSPRELRPPLPQRIRAGCDPVSVYRFLLRSLCHSAFVRVATQPLL